jgi:hypothetical protein
MKKTILFLCLSCICAQPLEAMKRGASTTNTSTTSSVSSSSAPTSPELKRRKTHDDEVTPTNTNNTNSVSTNQLNVLDTVTAAATPAVASHNSSSLLAQFGTIASRAVSGFMGFFRASKSPEEQALDKINNALEVNETEQNRIENEIAAQTAKFNVIKTTIEQRTRELNNQKKELRSDNTLRNWLFERNRLDASIKNAYARLQRLKTLHNTLTNRKNTIQKQQYKKTVQQAEQAIQQSKQHIQKTNEKIKNDMLEIDKQLDDAEAQNAQLNALLSQHLPGLSENDNIDDIDCKSTAATTSSSSSSSSTSTATHALNANAGDDNSLTPEEWSLLNPIDQKNDHEDKKDDKK